MNQHNLIAEISRKGKNIPQIATEIGISKTAMYRKIHGETEFSRREISELINCLQLEKEIAFEIFFGS